MSTSTNPNGVGALLKAHRVVLIRAVNGWMVTTERGGLVDPDKTFFCFESTRSLAHHLVAMLGETKWIVAEQPRHDKGKFQPKEHPANE